MMTDIVLDCVYLGWMNEKSEIGRRIALARNNKDLTLDAVCLLVPGLTKTTLNSYELGARTLPIHMAKKLAPIYGVSAAYLLTISDDMTEDVLIQKYRQADQRGKETIQRVAGIESPDKGTGENGGSPTIAA